MQAAMRQIVTGHIGRGLSFCKDTVNCVAMSGDDRFVATGSTGGCIKIWTTHTCELVHKFEIAPEGNYFGNPEVYQVLFTDNCQELVSATHMNSDYTVHVHKWRLDKDNAGTPTPHTLTREGGTVMRLSPDGQKLLLRNHHGSQISICSMQTGKKLLSWHYGPPFSEGIGCFGDLAWSPDGKLVATAGKNHPDVGVWNADTGVLVEMLHKDLVNTSNILGCVVQCVAFGATSDLIIIGSNIEMFIWELSKGKSVRKWGRASAASHISLSPDRKYLVSKSSFSLKYSSYVALWEVATGQLIGQLCCDTNAKFVVWSRDCQFIVTASTQKIDVWDVVQVC
jgi:WD40 repeat protein